MDAQIIYGGIILRIALIQSNIVWENKQKNITSAEKIISENADKNIDFFFFPEMSFTGFSMNVDSTKENDYFTTNQMKQLAISYNAGIGYGWVKDAGIKCKNIYSLVSKEGCVIGEFEKQHPFSYAGEDEYFFRGEYKAPIYIDGTPVCTFICYDLRFPEIFRKVCKRTHVIVIPANWPSARKEQWEILLRARALENQVYIFAINCQGNIGGTYYSGGSCIINPKGEIVNDLSDEEGIIIYDFMDNVEEFRREFPVLSDMID